MIKWIVAAIGILVVVLVGMNGMGAAQVVTPTPTPDPYTELTVDALTARTYGTGELQIVQVLEQAPHFTRYLIAYPSDGLTIYGFMNVPNISGTFPVIIALHGYINPSVYETLDYTTHYADALANVGFLVIHPNLRGYAPSDDGPNMFRVGSAIDILNLIALVKSLGGQPGPLQQANPDAIGLWGHSMGGGISLRVITVSPDVRAAVLYGSMSGDEVKNYEQIQIWSNGASGRDELNVPPETLSLIAPINYLDRIQAVISIHHGTDDGTVPLEWSLDLCSRLRLLRKNVECYTYDGQPHTFYGDSDQLFIQRTISFFTIWLKNT